MKKRQFMKTGSIIPGLILFGCSLMLSCSSGETLITRERILINDHWKFFKYASTEEADDLIYDVRPEEVFPYQDNKDADTKPTEALAANAEKEILKAWILPTGNAFIKDPLKRYQRPEVPGEAAPGADFPFVLGDFDDSKWESLDLPHDWGIEGPFLQGWEADVGGGMGRLASHGVAWYRKKLHIPAEDRGRQIYLDMDGAMSYAMVWINGQLAGGWPYGYNSFRIDLTPYVSFGGDNQLAIRIDNPPKSSRWYPGGGIYRNVWLVNTHQVHVAQWGSVLTTPEISEKEAKITLSLKLENHVNTIVKASLNTAVFRLDAQGTKNDSVVARFPSGEVEIEPGASREVESSTLVKNPKLWGPAPTQKANLYLAETEVIVEGEVVDNYLTRFGIRSLVFDAEKGLFVNGEHIIIRGANQHHDLGSLGTAFNVRAAERQLKLLQEMGCNAIRMAHNPPAPELLDLCDNMGILVIDEIYDVWERRKTPFDFHLIFPEWWEQDARAFMRRDRNHPSVIIWSLGNEVGEQYTGEEGAAIARKLHELAKEEDPTRPTAVSMNYARPHMALPPVMDVVSLNYQGEGIRNAPAYSHLKGISTMPLYPAFHEKFPDKMIISSENAAAVSSRGEFVFPVDRGISAPVSDSAGSDPRTMQVSAYELYTAPFGSSADKVFGSLEKHPYVAGGFVWSGWDYLGEPTPFYLARSSYYGVIDLAGFKKERFYLYQSHWRQDHPMVHILPHWNWPERLGQQTPVHVFTSGDEAELFLNGESLGRRKKGEYEYRLRWDKVIYEPGVLKAVAYKEGKPWAEEVVRTTGEAAMLKGHADRNLIRADGRDLSFITVELCDANQQRVPTAKNRVRFNIQGPGEIVATDNGDPYCMTPFPSPERNAFNGLILAIIKGKPDEAGTITLKAEADGLEETLVIINTK